MNSKFAEQHQIVMGFLPVNMATGANAGDWVSMKNFGRLTIALIKGPGAAAQDPIITLEQAVNVSAGSAKPLNIARVDKKQAATDLTAVAEFTSSTAESPASGDTFSTNTWTNSDLAEQAAIVLIDVNVTDLDIDNDFDCVRATIADVGSTAQLGALIYILSEPRYSPNGVVPGAISN